MTTAPALAMLLKMFHLPAFVNNYEDLARKAEKESITYERYWLSWKAEAYERHNRKIAQLLKRSGLPRETEIFEQDRLPKRSAPAADLMKEPFPRGKYPAFGTGPARPNSMRYCL
jgi:hypothetical protein